MPGKRLKPVGAIAVDLGYASEEQVRGALTEQRNLEHVGSKVSIGTLMEQMGAISHDQLLRVLSKSGDLNPPISEDAIRLAARIKTSTGDERSIINVTAAVRGEGVTTVATHLASALAMMSRDGTLLVDTNIHHPRIHKMFGIDLSPGFADVVEDRANWSQACRRTEIPGLWVLPAGLFEADPLISLMADNCASILREMSERQFRYIIIDSAPLIGRSDATLTASRSDGTILVVCADKRRKSEVLEMKRILDGLNVNILGSILRK